MQIVKSLSDLKLKNPKGIAISFGNFDGFHRGHQKLILEQQRKALDLGLDLVIVTFNPHPKKILRNEDEPFLLTSREKKNQLLEKSGCLYLVEIAFSRDFSTLSAHEFLESHILSFSPVRAIFLGWDFAFGANKAGDSSVVRKICEDLRKDNPVEVFNFPAYEFDGTFISSSLIRNQLAAGNVEKVNGMLGRMFSVSGLVVKGEGRGRIIGVPTANLSFSDDIIIPQRGVYSTFTSYRGMNYKSVTNIGYNPTFNVSRAISVETHLLDFDEYIYGDLLEVHFAKRIRDEKKFSSVNDLIEQIKKDIEFVRDDKCD